MSKIVKFFHFFQRNCQNLVKNLKFFAKICKYSNKSTKSLKIFRLRRKFCLRKTFFKIFRACGAFFAMSQKIFSPPTCVPPPENFFWLRPCQTSIAVFFAIVMLNFNKEFYQIDLQKVKNFIFSYF